MFIIYIYIYNIQNNYRAWPIFIWARKNNFTPLAIFFYEQSNDTYILTLSS